MHLPAIRGGRRRVGVDESVREVSRSREVHRDAGRVGGSDDLFVTYRPAWLYDGSHPTVDERLEPVGEGEERIRRGDSPGGTVSGSMNSKPRSVDAVDLAHA